MNKLSPLSCTRTIFRMNSSCRRLVIPVLVMMGFACSDRTGTGPDNAIRIRVDVAETLGEMDYPWAMFGYDEPNYTYMKDGRKLLSELAELSPVPVYVRAHNLLTSGDGTPALKWGSSNAYTEDPGGNPVYDWTITDSIFDTYVEREMKPLVEIGFMPEALSSRPVPYRHSWRPGASYGEIFTGWAFPPTDYTKWSKLVFEWVKHCVSRYGKGEVESWYWEVWNEPNIGYWQGTLEEYLMLYDYAAEAVKSALPEARIGGPHTTGPSWDEAEAYLRTFLEHTLTGTNFATGETGSPLDFIAFHAKGRPVLQDSIILMNMGTQLRDVSKGFETVASYPSLKDLPVIIGECDPEGCAACSMQDYPENAYRNGTMYSSYTAASFPRIYDLADHFQVNLRGIVTWAFEFEDQPWFNGYRDLATHGIDKPVLNVFRMFGMMHGHRVRVSGDLAYDFMTVRDSSVRGERPDINALAVASDTAISVLVWNYHDLDRITPAVPVRIELSGIPFQKGTLYHYRVDRDHSNAYESWKAMGAPREPTEAQYGELEAAGRLQPLAEPVPVKARNDACTLQLDLPGQAVSLLILRNAQ
jgi:xylan 1,4-beta-xylosidase